MQKVLIKTKSGEVVAEGTRNGHLTFVGSARYVMYDDDFLALNLIVEEVVPPPPKVFEGVVSYGSFNCFPLPFGEFFCDAVKDGKTYRITVEEIVPEQSKERV